MSYLPRDTAELKSTHVGAAIFAEEKFPIIQDVERIGSEITALDARITKLSSRLTPVLIVSTEQQVEREIYTENCCPLAHALRTLEARIVNLSDQVDSLLDRIQL